MKILIVEDEPSLRELIQRSLEKERYVVETAGDFNSALCKIEDYDYDCVLLDIMLPDGSGLELLERLKALHKRENVIIISAKDSLEDKVLGLELGADDYVTKPFGMGELMARMRVCLRRAGNKEGEPILTCGGLQLNLLEHRVVVEGREVKLTPTEYELLKVMLKYAGRVLTHKQLLKAVWGNEYDTDTHYIRIYMRQLRRKIEPDPAQPKYLITEAGIGYRLLGGE